MEKHELIPLCRKSLIAYAIASWPGYKPGDRVVASFFPTWLDGPLSDYHHANALGGGLQDMLSSEAQAQALAAGTAEHREAVGRFLNKQPPLFAWPALKD